MVEGVWFKHVFVFYFIIIIFFPGFVCFPPLSKYDSKWGKIPFFLSMVPAGLVLFSPGF